MEGHMKRLLSLAVFGIVLAFAGVNVSFAGDPPAPTDDQGKDKKGSGGKLFGNDPKDEKKDDKGGK